MTAVAILGGGAGGLSAATELTAAGHSVRLWNRRGATIEPLRAVGGVAATGVLGEGFTPVPVITTSLPEALADADIAVICLPALAHASLADELARLRVRIPLILNPGHTLGAVHVASRFVAAGVARPPIAELSTLTYVARVVDGARVNVTGTAGRVRAAALGVDESALEFAIQLWPACRPEPDVFATSLANVNLVLHPPAAILAAAWVEATGGRFAYYAEATTPAVASVMASLDDERLSLAAAFGHKLDTLIDEMAAIGTVDAAPRDGTPAERLRVGISTGRANAAIMAPSSLEHRYYREDFAYGVVPMLGLASIAGTAAPIAHSLLRLADCALGGAATRNGLTPDILGLDGGSASALVDAVTNGEI